MHHRLAFLDTSLGKQNRQSRVILRRVTLGTGLSAPYPCLLCAEHTEQVTAEEQGAHPFIPLSTGFPSSYSCEANISLSGQWCKPGETRWGMVY